MHGIGAPLIVWPPNTLGTAAAADAGTPTATASAAVTVSMHLLLIRGKNISAGEPRVRRLPDQQPAPEHPLERLTVAVALEAPAGQGQVAGCVQVEVDAV